MSDPRITDEVVELASAASWNCQLPSWWIADGETAQPIPTWDEISEQDREPYRVTTRAALEAALPHLAPQPVVDREEMEKALRSVLAREGVDEFHDPQPLGWKLADAVIDFLNGAES